MDISIYSAFLDELDRVKKARAAGEMDPDEALFRIARLILPKATVTTEEALRNVAPSLWPLVEKARAPEGGTAGEEVRDSIEEIERVADRMIASAFLTHGEEEIADLYGNDQAEFNRRYERGYQIYLAQAGPTEQGKH